MLWDRTYIAKTLLEVSSEGDVKHKLTLKRGGCALEWDWLSKVEKFSLYRDCCGDGAVGFIWNIIIIIIYLIVM